MHRRTALARLAAAATTPAAIDARAQVRDLADAVDKAGRQRTLGQRMVKAYLAIGQGVLPDVADRVLDVSQGQFDRRLVELRSFAPSPEIRTTYHQLDAAWSEFKTTLVGTAPSRAGALRLLPQGEQLLALAHQGAVQFEITAGRPGLRLAGLAGRQRMLGQRMAAMTLAAAWGVRAPAALQEARRARDEHALAHEQLLAAPQTNDAVREELALASIPFGFLDGALQQLRVGGATPRTLRDAFTASERLLDLMEAVVASYLRLAD